MKYISEISLIKTLLSSTKREHKQEAIKILDELAKQIGHHSKPRVVVEDGSVDTDELEKQGYEVIVYRQGSTPPIIEGFNTENAL